jgi:hypothetical protein
LLYYIGRISIKKLKNQSQLLFMPLAIHAMATKAKLSCEPNPFKATFLFGWLECCLHFQVQPMFSSRQLCLLGIS